MAPEISIRTRSDTNLSIHRHIRAARHRVFEAFTNPDQVRSWYWYLDKPMVTCDIEFRKGGSWRFAWKGEEGNTIGCRGEYLQADAPRSFVQTGIWDGDCSGDFAPVTAEFSEAGNGTDVTIAVDHDSRKSRDAMLVSNVRVILHRAFDRLDLYLAEQRT